MKSVRESKRVKAEQGRKVSLRAVAREANLGGTISLKTLFLRGLDPQSHEWKKTLEAGDVKADMTVTAWSNGLWALYVKLHDDGVIAGDSYALGFTFTHMTDGKAHGDGVSGELRPGSDATATKKAQAPDLWIAENWAGITAGDVRATLHSAWNVSDVLSFLAVGAAVVIFGAIVASKAQPSSVDNTDPEHPVVVYEFPHS
jgi:hypothetical protein